MVKNILFSGFVHPSKTFDFGLCLLRVFTGLAMAFGHGLGKFPPSDQFISGVGKLGLPMPAVFAWSASITELFGGILLAIGLATRPSAVFLFITMAVAALLRHGADPFNVKEKALLYLFVFLLFAIAGSGRFGMDRMIQGK